MYCSYVQLLLWYLNFAKDAALVRGIQYPSLVGYRYSRRAFARSCGMPEVLAAHAGSGLPAIIFLRPDNLTSRLDPCMMVFLCD